LLHSVNYSQVRCQNQRVWLLPLRSLQ
jgi:hypothetical protein